MTDEEYIYKMELHETLVIMNGNGNPDTTFTRYGARLCCDAINQVKE